MAGGSPAQPNGCSGGDEGRAGEALQCKVFDDEEDDLPEKGWARGPEGRVKGNAGEGHNGLLTAEVNVGLN